MNIKKMGLLPKILIAIALGIVCSFFLPGWAVRVFLTFNSIFSNFLGMFIPLLIIGLVAPGIAELGKGAGKLLLITVVLAYGSTVLSGAFAYGYDNARSLTIKCQYIIEHNLAGGMYWEYANDDNMGTERHTVYDCLIGNASQSGIGQPEASAPQTRKLRTLQTYDLLGRAVTNPHQGGIYFKKGSPLGSRLTTQRKALTNNRF